MIRTSAPTSATSTLVFLHPVGLDSAAGHELGLPGVVAPTLAGHPPRRRVGPHLRLGHIADEVAGWTAGPLDVVGASLGGMVALHLALDHPDRVRSLVLANTTARPDPEALEWRAATTEARGALDMVEETMQRWFRTEVLARGDAVPGVAYARRRLAAMETGALADTWRAISHHDVLGRLPEIDVPTTLVIGTADLSTPPEGMHAMAERLPHARTVELDAAHMAFLEEPDRFRRIVEDHLAWTREDNRMGAADD